MALMFYEKWRKNRSTYDKSAKGSAQACPQIPWAPQINE